MSTLDQYRSKRPGNRANIERIKADMRRDAIRAARTIRTS